MNASYQPPPIPKALESCAEILYEQSRNRTGQDRDMICFQKIAERRIIEAINRGEFDNLPGAGQPLELVDDSHVPEDLRMAYLMLKNAGFVPPEIYLIREFVKTEQLLACMEDT